MLCGGRCLLPVVALLIAVEAGRFGNAVATEYLDNGGLFLGADELFTLLAIEIGAAAAKAILYSLLHGAVLHFGHEVENVAHASGKALRAVAAVGGASLGQGIDLGALEVDCFYHGGKHHRAECFAIDPAAQAMFPQGALTLNGGAAGVARGHGCLLWHDRCIYIGFLILISKFVCFD